MRPIEILNVIANNCCLGSVSFPSLDKMFFELLPACNADIYCKQVVV